MADAGPYRVAVHETLASTNDEAMAALRGGDPGGLFVVAARQSGGRGRQGRVWVSPPGNLYASLALLDPAPPHLAPQLGFVAGVALVKALRGRLGAAGDARLKWPNDVVVSGAKLAGILLESAMLPSGQLACVAGFGVNCLSHPDGLAYAATDLRQAGDPDASPDAVLALLAVEMDAQLRLWDRGAGFASIRRSWLEHAAGLGRAIKVAMPRRTVSGTFRDIDASGHLVVETNEGCVTVAAGDVFLADPTADAMQEQNKMPPGISD